MNKINKFALLGLFLLPTLVLAQEQDPSVLITALIQALTSSGGISVLAVVAAIVQIVIYIFKQTPIGQKLAGKWMLLIVSGLTIVSGVIGMMMNGASLGAALVSSSVLASFQVFLNQVYKLFIEKKA